MVPLTHKWYFRQEKQGSSRVHVNELGCFCLRPQLWVTDSGALICQRAGSGSHRNFGGPSNCGGKEGSTSAVPVETPKLSSASVSKSADLDSPGLIFHD